MAFVSWAAEKAKVENQISSLNDQLMMKSLTGTDRQLVQRDLGELQKYYEFICQRVAHDARTGGSRINVVNFG